MNFFNADVSSSFEAKEKAQWIAYAPFVFQAARALRDFGILEYIESQKPDGVTTEQVAQEKGLTNYGARVLMEAGLGIGLLLWENDQFTLSKTGFFILSDPMTKVNMDFAHDVCYEGLFRLDESIRYGKPEGLKVFGDWKTVYDGLSKLPVHVQRSWFGFDHYYSDNAFPSALATIFKDKPKRLLDIGGNTGKWATACVKHDSDVLVTIMDLPGQLDVAKKNVEAAGLSHRISFFQNDILDESKPFPKNFDAIWMSQFLDCFSEDEIVSILKRCRDALSENGFVYILETLWDRQKFKTSAFCLQMTSIYFTAIANGNSQMYSAKTFLKCVELAGFEVVEETDHIGFSHSLLKCKKI
jgi:ubiquinone/menaquinone biosynthesis C-methylase UbiE